MFIPTPVQELHLPLTQKLEVGPVLPVTAVPGVAEEAQSLDSRVALQWTQPVFAGAEGQAGRSALTAPLPQALLQSPKTAVPGYEPQGADPDALKSGEIHPLLAQGLSTWLSGVLAKSSGNLNLVNLSQLMAKVSSKTTGAQAEVSDAPSNIESDSISGTAKPATQANLSASDEVVGQPKTVNPSLPNSSLATLVDRAPSTNTNVLATTSEAAAQPKTINPSPPNQSLDTSVDRAPSTNTNVLTTTSEAAAQPERIDQSPANNAAASTLATAKSKSQTAPTTSLEAMVQLKAIYQTMASSDVFAAQRLNEAWMPRRVMANSTPPLEEPSVAPKVRSSKLFKSEASRSADFEAIQQLAQPVQAPSASQLTQWVSALEPDSAAAEQAARMLTQGNMVWQAELVPGLPMRIVREDAWRNNPQQAGQLEKGAMLKVEISLPNLGALRIVGSQWGQDISLHISHGKPDGSGRVNWTALAPELLQELKAQGVSVVKIESLAETPGITARDDLPQEAPNV